MEEKLEQAHLYDVLREFDHKDVDMIYSEGFEGEPLSEAIMNRMVKEQTFM